MNNIGKGLLGCSGALAIIVIFLGVLKLLFGNMFEFLIFPAFFILLIIVAVMSETVSELIKAGKWLGLGAVLGNIFNNKINADTAVKSGKDFKKKKSEIKNPVVNNIVDFISPTMEDDVTQNVEISDSISEEDYQEFQEFLKWKKLHETDDKK